MTDILNKVFEAPRVFFEDGLTRLMSALKLHDLEANVARNIIYPEPIQKIAKQMDRAGLTSRALLREYNLRYPERKLPDPYDDY